MIEDLVAYPYFIILLVLCTLVLVLSSKPKLYKGIPEVAAYPLVGIVHLLTTITGSYDSHHEVLETLLRTGPISQGNFLGQNLLIVNDPLVLKEAFDKE